MAFSDTNTVGFIIGIIGLIVAIIFYVAILRRPQNRLLQALILLGILDSGILITIPFFDTLSPSWNGYNTTTLSFDGKMIFSDGKFTFAINNNNQSLLKYLNIYGMDKKSSIIVQTNMTDAAGNMKNYLTFNDTKTQITITKVAGDPERIDLHVNIPSGLFQGWIIISGKNPTSIPITVATDPKTAEAVGWIIVGILTSIIIWEVILYFKPPKPDVAIVAQRAAASTKEI